MSKQTKQIISESKLKEDLKFRLKCDAMEMGLTFLLYFWYFGILTMAPLKTFVIVLIILLPSSYFVYFLYTVISRAVAIKNNKFTVVTEELTGMQRDEELSFAKNLLQLPLLKAGLFKRCCDALYFTGYDPYFLTPSDRSVFEYSNINDVFYIVVYNSKKQFPVIAYNSNVYEIKK